MRSTSDTTPVVVRRRRWIQKIPTTHSLGLEWMLKKINEWTAERPSCGSFLKPTLLFIVLSLMMYVDDLLLLSLLVIGREH